MANCCPVQWSFENFLLRGWDFIVDLAEQRLLKPLEQVQLWLSKAETMITEAEELVSNAPQQMNNLCLGGCASKSCLSSYKFGKNVAKMLQQIDDHKSKGAFEKVADNQSAASVVVRPVEQPVALESTIQKVWSCIVETDVGIIGLYGLGGVGKTTLLTKLNNKFSTTQNDFKVIWALVSKDYDVGKIQDRIGGNLGFSDDSWKEKSVDQKATDIYGVLHNKKFVVLLDDLWERVALNQVGIPIPSQENGSKLIFTTRSLEVCGEMGARKKIKVECLELEKAWELFQDKVGYETLNSHPDIQNLAKQVAERCGGLPLALITIGRAMACKTTLGEWKYAIEMLKRCALPKMENEVFPLLKFSYDNLPNATMKCCLLYCCLHPEDYCIPKNRLVEYWFCEGLLNEFDRISDAQMQGDDIINSLLNACLLENGDELGEDCVKMHDVIRDMALWITHELKATENDFFVKAGAQLFEEPDVKIWESVKRMSVMENKLEVLNETPKCPNLRTLFLSQNELKVINDGFFQFIPHLIVLDLSKNPELQTLPKGISQLISLECLDLSYTGMEELPIELKSLTKLKMLDLNYMENLKRIPQHLISSFSKLQIFRMLLLENGDYPDEDNVLSGGHEKLIEELKEWKSCGVYSCANYTSRFHTLSSVTIIGCNKLRDVTWLILAPNLRNLELYLCLKMEEILSEGKLGEVASVIGSPYPKPFLKLETLYLQFLPKLKSIYWDALPFPCLKLIRINLCGELKKLPFNSDSAKGNLLSIEGSKDWWATVEWKNEATRDVFLPSFKSVYG
ncbi:disease resistance protein RPS5-like [Gossypium arboreum]|uniref:disease resistance protein RPS5-like n=1 Tax=Gossypium arboreum TaxID=29729 RepID=UPI0022F16CF5|nr:disease resistance protein RPS5-like [Gossypium arboreum]